MKVCVCVCVSDSLRLHALPCMVRVQFFLQKEPGPDSLMDGWWCCLSRSQTWDTHTHSIKPHALPRKLGSGGLEHARV